MHIDPANLPPYTAISSKPIREAAGALDAAKAAQNEAKRTLVDLQQTREQALDEDARTDEQARAEGKPATRTRTATAAHDKATEAAEHELRVSGLATERAYEALTAALDEHGDTWRADMEKLVGSLDASWENTVAELVKLHTERVRALSVARALGSKHVGVGAVSLDRRQLGGALELAQGSVGSAEVAVEDLLVGLSDLGKAVEPVEHEPVTPIHVASVNASDGGVQREQAEREAEAEALAERPA